MHNQQPGGGTDRLHAQGQLGDQRQAAPAAAQQAHQVVARHILHHPAAGLGVDAIASQQSDTDDLVAHAQVPLAQPAGQTAGHKSTDAAGPSVPRWVDGQPLAFLGQKLLQGVEVQAGLHGDRQVIDGMVDDLIEQATTQDWMVGVKGGPQVR